MLRILFLVTALLLGNATALTVPRDESLNNYIDMVLDNVQVLLIENGFDPAKLPNETIGFSDTILGITWHGEAALYDGWLRGLSTIYRSDDADFIRDDNNIIIGMSTGMGLSTMQGHYTCLAQFMDLGPVADVTMEIGATSLSFDAALDRSICRFQVSKLEVTRIGHISIDIHGLGPLNWIFEILASSISNIVKFFIENMVENIIKGIVNDVLNVVDLGPLGPLIGCESTQYDHHFSKDALVAKVPRH